MSGPTLADAAKKMEIENRIQDAKLAKGISYGFAGLLGATVIYSALQGDFFGAAFSGTGGGLLYNSGRSQEANIQRLQHKLDQLGE